MKYNRILLKLSGESLQGTQKYGLSTDVLHSYAEQIKAVVGTGVQVGIVIGGGNIFRGLQGARKGFDRVKGDQMGMLATIINSLALQSALEDNGVKAKVLTSIRMEPIGEYYSKAKALDYLEAGYVVIIGGGTSNPYFSTDSASALRGIELEADVMLKGTRVDGVYTADPEKDPAAEKFDEITFDEVYRRKAAISGVMLGISSNKYVILLIINVILLIVGTFMDMTPACLIFTPIFLPICQAVGMNTIHFGIMMIFNLCIGTITPPVGTTLFVGVKVGKTKIEDVIKPLLYYFAAIFIVLLLVTYIPAISLWLPGLLGYVK